MPKILSEPREKWLEYDVRIQAFRFYTNARFFPTIFADCPTIFVGFPRWHETAARSTLITECEFINWNQYQ